MRSLPQLPPRTDKEINWEMERKAKRAKENCETMNQLFEQYKELIEGKYRNGTFKYQQYKPPRDDWQIVRELTHVENLGEYTNPYYRGGIQWHMIRDDLHEEDLVRRAKQLGTKKDVPNRDYFQKCLDLADLSDCKKIHYGALVVQLGRRTDEAIRGRGYNHVAHPSLKDSCCLRKDIPSGTRVEQCNAIHAEQAAILDAELMSNQQRDSEDLGPQIQKDITLFVAGKKLNGEIIRRDEKGFYCTLCARMIADIGIDDIRVLTKKGEERMTLVEILKYSGMVARGEKRVTWTK